MSSYILQGKIPVPAKNQLEWEYWFESANREVALTVLHKGLLVSTVFIGMNKNRLFETCVFRGEMKSKVMNSYNTWEEAEQGHKALCEELEKK